MAGKNFDISKFAATLKPVSESDHTGPEQIEYIDIGLLDGDERNFYQLTDIDELADNIQMCGLQQPSRLKTRGVCLKHCLRFDTIRYILLHSDQL